MRKITYKQYLDKIWGGWVGKCAGGILGAPILVPCICIRETQSNIFLFINT